MKFTAGNYCRCRKRPLDVGENRGGRFKKVQKEEAISLEAKEPMYQGIMITKTIYGSGTWSLTLCEKCLWWKVSERYAV